MKQQVLDGPGRECNTSFSNGTHIPFQTLGGEKKSLSSRQETHRKRRIPADTIFFSYLKALCKQTLNDQLFPSSNNRQVIVLHFLDLHCIPQSSLKYIMLLV